MMTVNARAAGVVHASPQAAACGEACGGTPASEAKSSEDKGGVTPGKRAIGFPTRPSRGLHPMSPLRYYPTASCGTCLPTSTAPHPYGPVP